MSGSWNTTLLGLWTISLGAAALYAWTTAVLAKPFHRLGPAHAGVGIALPVAVLVAFAIVGFHTLDRPVFHWVLARENPVSLRFGTSHDPLAWVTAFCFGVALLALVIRNRPGVRATAAALGAWAGLCLVGSSKTGWTAFLGIAIQVVSSALPLLSGAGEEGVGFEYDSRWSASSRRSWIGLLLLLSGAVGLATLGVRLDFPIERSWARLDHGFPSVTAAALFIGGLATLMTTAFTARASQLAPVPGDESALELRHFSFEGAISWSALIIVFRLHDAMKGTPWPFVLSCACAAAAFLSFPSLLFNDRRSSAGAQWSASLPALVAAVIPMIPAQEAFFMMAAMTAVSGALLVCFQSPRGKMSVGFSVFFLLAASGLAGGSVSAGLARFFTGIEEAPIYRGIVAFLWLLYFSAGWRIAIRREGTREEPRPAVGAVALAFLVPIAFGPLVSGRWSGGSVPELLDWILAARHWPWLDRFTAAPSETSWIGFGFSQAIWPLAILIGTFAWRSSKLFPFASRNPRAWEIVSGMFGLFPLHDLAARGLETAGGFWERRLSRPLWERAIPRATAAAFERLARLGHAIERVVDPLTAESYGRALRAPAKLVRWFHGGNARLYAWFALIWILIFSLYLARS
jgi:hypothetical protein